MKKNLPEQPPAANDSLSARSETPSPTPGRRLAAIMFTDIVGYSTLVHRNETLGLELLNEHRAIVRAHLQTHRGREIDTAGDGFVVEFASTLDAVRCAIQIQESFAARNRKSSPERTIKLRIGIHTADVVPSNSGGKHGIYGDGVNIAARLQPLAPSGGICISSTVYEQINGRIDCPVNYMGEGKLKGIDSPVRLYSVDLNNPNIVRRIRRRLSISPRIRRLTIAAASFALITSAVGLVTYFQPLFLEQLGMIGKSAERGRVAVLPFEITGLNEEEAFIPDGLVSDLISSLSQNGIHVLAKDTVVELRKTHPRPKQLGKELNIGRLVIGSFRKISASGARASFALRLSIISTASEEVEWSKDYTIDESSLSEAQSTISQDLRSRLLNGLGATNRVTHTQPKNDAYLAFMRGQFFLGKRTVEDLGKAVKEFAVASELDPQFAGSLAALSKVINLHAWYGLKSPTEAQALSVRYATQALMIDPQNTDALISLAENTAYVDFNFPEAEKLFLKGIASNKNDATAHQWYGEFLGFMGRTNEAEKQTQLALELDPLSLIAANSQAMIAYYAKKYDRALRLLKSANDLDANFMLTNFWLGQVFAAKREFPAAIQYLNKAAELSRGSFMVKAALAYAYAKSQQQANALKIRQELEDSAKTLYVSPYHFAVIAIGLGDRDAAMRELEKSVSQRGSQTILLLRDPRFDELRSRADFNELIGKMKAR